jgi:seryl-tRNA synthetase
MTPEERFRNIENLLNMLSESHVQFHSEMEELKEAQRELNETQTRQEAQINKNAAAIRDLILVSRSVLDSITRLGVEDEKLREAQRASEEKLREAQRVTEEKLNALIEIVDRIIRDRNR